MVCDGLSVLQMFSLMQDGGDVVAKETNRVMYPNRIKLSCTESQIQNINCHKRLKALNGKMGPNTLLINKNNQELLDQSVG